MFGSVTKEETKAEEDKTGSEPPPPQEEKVNGTAPVDDIFAKFLQKSSGWSCEVCMISNGADATKCAACETPRPGAAVKPPPTSVPSVSEQNPPDDLFAKFLTKSSGKWTCDICMVTNEADKNTCLACESPKPGYQPPAPEPSKEQTQQVGTSAFKFGFTASQTEEKSSASSGFKFGSDAASEAPGGGGGLFGGFKFGSSTETESKPNGGFLFGTSTESKSTGGFLFGMSTATDAEKTVAGGFQFGSSADVDKEESVSSDNSAGKGFRFTDKIGSKLESDASDTPKTKSKKGEYLSNLKSLNTQVTSWIKTHVDKNPLVDLTPVFKDYEKHIGKLRTKYNISAPAPAEQVKDATKVLSFGSSPSPFSAAFGSNQVPKPVVGFGQTTGFQFGMAGTGETKPEDKEKIEKQEEEEEDESSKKPADPVVEEDAIFSQKCKLYYKKADTFVERGKGYLHLKMPEGQKVQLVIRADTSLGNILLNTLVTSSTPLERKGKKDVMLVTVPNPPIDPKAESEPVTFLVRVKATEDADELKQKLNDLCNK